MSGHTRQRRIDAGPTRCLGSPDRGRWTNEFAIIESAGPDENEMGSSLGFAEYLRSAPRTKAPVHRVAAVGNTGKVAKLTFHADRGTGETDIDRAVTRP